MATDYAPKVLIVDDDLIVCADLSTILKNYGPTKFLGSHHPAELQSS